MSDTLSWLHLSDFHVGMDNYGQRQLFHELLTHIANRIENVAMPDLVIISGDLANSGKAQEYELFLDEFLSPLVGLLGAEPRVYMVPGNHDVDRSQAKIIQLKGILRQSHTLLDPSPEGRADRQALMPRFRNFTGGDPFHVTTHHWLESEQGYFLDQFTVGIHKVAVIGINTAWFCQGDDDRHQLSPGKPILESALKLAKGCSLKLVIGHHPIDWFLDEDAESIGALLAREGVVYLHGHLHATRTKFDNYGVGSFLALQAGAAFQGREKREWVNRIIWAHADLLHRELRLEPYQWSTTNQEWTLDSSSLHSRLRRPGADFWVMPLPEEQTGGPKKPAVAPESGRGKPAWAGWSSLDSETLETFAKAPADRDRILAYFDGRSPSWAEALHPSVPRRAIVQEVTNRLALEADRNCLSLHLLLGAGGEGKSTAIRQIAGALAMQTRKWRVLWHDDSDSSLKLDYLRSLKKEAPLSFLLVSDDAELIAKEVFEAVKYLHNSGRTDIHFLLSARDTDWRSVDAHQLPWALYSVFVSTRVRGLTETDARLIVEAWSAYGKDGLGRLAGLTLEEASSRLLEESRLEEASEGAFLGAMLRTRIGEELKDHVTSLLHRLRQRVYPMGTLADAFAYIAALHAENVLVLNRDVLAKALGLDSLSDLRRLVLAPLGEEAAVGSFGTSLLTRHRAIAETAVQLLSDRVDFDEVFVDLVVAAVDVRHDQDIVPNLNRYERLSTHFYEKGNTERALRLANALVKRRPDNAFYVTNLAHLYRSTGQTDLAIKLFRTTPPKCEKDRVFFQTWASVEAEGGNSATAAYLYWYGMSDGVMFGPVLNDTARVGLVGMAKTLTSLSEQSNDTRLVTGKNCAAHLCGRLKLDDRTKRQLAQIQPVISATDVASEFGSSLGMTTLATAALAAWEHLERPLPAFIQPPSRVSTIRLAEQLHCVPAAKSFGNRGI